MSTANSHPGLGFNLRRGFPATPHSNPPNKGTSSLSQHASQYQTQGYTPQQAPQGTYPTHLFSTPSPQQVSGVSSSQNGSRPPPQHQVASALPGSRQRPPPPRQMQPPTNQPLSYLHQALNHPQPLNPQQLSQQISQQPMSQPSMSQQSLNQQQLGQQQHSMNQQHSSQHPSQHQSQHSSQQPLNPQQLSQQTLSALSQQPISLQSISQAVQQNDNSMVSQKSTPHSQSQTTLPPAPSHTAQIPQVQQVQQVQQGHQQPTPPQPEPAQPARQDHDEDMDMVSPGESGEGDMSMEPKMVEGTPFVRPKPMGEIMSAPPEGGSFPTLEAVHKYVLNYCTSVGYAIVIGRSKKTVPGLKKVLFVCDRAGKPPKRVSPEMRKRKTSSRKCDCQFGFFAIEQRTQWTVRYRPDPDHLKHNHGPSESPLNHPAARKLDSKMVAAVKALKESGVGVTQTLEILQQDNPTVPLLPRDIYNARAAINRNPQKVATGLAENRPAIYSKPHPSAEERIRADLRKELAKAREDYDKLKETSDKEIEDLKKKLVEKDQIINKFEMFIDICNQRVMVQRERLETNGAAPSTNNP